MYLFLQDLIIKEGKKDILVFDSSFLVNLYSKYINSFATRDNEITLEFQFTFSKHLKRIYNLRIIYLATEVSTIEDDIFSTHFHCKLHLDISAAHTLIIDLILCLSPEYVFGSNIVNFR